MQGEGVFCVCLLFLRRGSGVFLKSPLQAMILSAPFKTRERVRKKTERKEEKGRGKKKGKKTNNLKNHPLKTLPRALQFTSR